MPYSVYELRPLVLVVQAWNEKGDHVHMVANLSNRAKVEELMSNVLGENVYLFPLDIDASQLSHKLPGIHKKVMHPVKKKEMDLFSVIINLNDVEGWSREKIADWIETLDDAPKFEVS